MITQFKIFEENIKFPKYFIWRFINDVFVISEVLDIRTTNVKTQVVDLVIRYTLNPIGEISKASDQMSYSKPLWIIKNVIIYSSDSLEDCLNILPTLASTLKYNL